MAEAMIPPGYHAVLLGRYSSLDETNQFEAMERGLAEGTPLLAKLVFESRPPADVLGQANQELKDQGVSPWPGYQDLVFIHPNEPAFYVAWRKGSPFWGLILGILGPLIALPLIGALIWEILPESFQQMIQMMILLPIMFLMMSMMGGSLTSAKPERKKEGT